ncbi:MAG: hypothetical protein LAT84_13590, partial [Balneolia bacterium]|nr:hypothetical protein [Balneolia bacterium]
SCCWCRLGCSTSFAEEDGYRIQDTESRKLWRGFTQSWVYTRLELMLLCVNLRVLCANLRPNLIPLQFLFR